MINLGLWDSAYGRRLRSFNIQHSRALVWTTLQVEEFDIVEEWACQWQHSAVSNFLAFLQGVRNLNEFTTSEGVKWEWGRKIHIFQPTSRRIFETVQD